MTINKFFTYYKNNHTYIYNLYITYITKNNYQPVGLKKIVKNYLKRDEN